MMPDNLKLKEWVFQASMTIALEELISPQLATNCKINEVEWLGIQPLVSLPETFRAFLKNPFSY